MRTRPVACRAHGVEFVALPVPDLGAPIESRLLAVSIAVAKGIALEAAIEVVFAARGVRVPPTAVQREWFRRNVDQLSGFAG